MEEITLRVLDGCDRGRVYSALRTPITIGREEGNTIQLNDERVSRFHVKIQEDNARLVLTDLESTNGTKINGEDIQLRILRYGDLISVGRSVLLFGSREQIADRLYKLRSGHSEAEPTINPTEDKEEANEALDFELNWSDDQDLQATLHVLDPPELPDRLSPGQAAQLSELLEYFHIRLRNILNAAKGCEQGDEIVLELRKWQNLVDLQSRLSEYLRHVGDPDTAE